MPFVDLETMPIQDYIARETSRAGLWFFLHIPKTAGSSFSTELTVQMSPYRNVEVDYTDESLRYDDKLIAAVNRFVGDMRRTHFRAASGHVPWELMGRIQAADPNARIISFLRDPESRMISEYRYQRTPTHPQHEAFKTQFPTMESYVHSPLSQNQMTRFLFGNHRQPSADELIDHIRHKFTFVGLVEMYALSFSCIFTAMGLPNLQPSEFQRKTESTQDNQVVITPELRTMIHEANHLDQAAYNYVHSILLRHRDAWHARHAA